MCVGVFGCVWVYAGGHGCLLECAGMSYEPMCAGVYGCVGGWGAPALTWLKNLLPFAS